MIHSKNRAKSYTQNIQFWTRSRSVYMHNDKREMLALEQFHILYKKLRQMHIGLMERRKMWECYFLLFTKVLKYIRMSLYSIYSRWLKEGELRATQWEGYPLLQQD